MSFKEKIRLWQLEAREKNDELKLKDYQALSDKEVAKRLNQLYGLLTKQYPSYPKLMMRSFVAGLFSALGATIGLSIVLAVLAYAFVQLKGLPGIGQLLDNPKVQEALHIKVESNVGEAEIGQSGQEK